jgi:hypothetical protein
MDQPRPRPDAPVPPRLAGGGGDLVARLERWAADARVDEAARARSRERWLRMQAEEDGTLVGVLADLQDAGAPVTVHTCAGGRHRGVVRAVGVDVLALDADDRPGGEVFVALAAVVAVRGGPGAPRVVGDRGVERTVRLLDVVVGLAAEREHVRLVATGGEAVAGVVRSVGRDLVVVQTPGGEPAVAYVPLDAVAEIVVTG